MTDIMKKLKNISPTGTIFGMEVFLLVKSLFFRRNSAYLLRKFFRLPQNALLIPG